MPNILVVDDSAADRELAGHLLDKQGWTVVYAEMAGRPWPSYRRLP